MGKVARLALAILACYRLGTLIAEDDGPGDVFRNLRKWTDAKRLVEQGDISARYKHVNGDWKIVESRGKWASIDDGINCPFCVGVWAAFLLAILVHIGRGDFLLLWLGIAGGQSLLQNLRRE